MLDEASCNTLISLIALEDYNYKSWDRLADLEEDKDFLHSLRNILLYTKEHKELKPLIRKLLNDALKDINYFCKLSTKVREEVEERLREYTEGTVG